MCKEEDWVNWAQSSYLFKIYAIKFKIYAIKFELSLKSFYIIVVKQNKFNCFVKYFNKSVNILIDR